MTLSLDTHAFLWWLEDPQLLSRAARKAIGDGKNIVYVSAAVVWEIAIKRALGKLDAPEDLEAAMAANRFLPLPVTIPHALAVAIAAPTTTATRSTACSSPRPATRASNWSAAIATSRATACPTSSPERLVMGKAWVP